MVVGALICALCLWSAGARPVAQVADLIGLGAPTTWLDNVDNVKVQPSDAADATRPDIWRYEGLKWVASGLGPAGEAGINLMDSYGTDWRFARIQFSDIGTIPAVDGDVWNATTGRVLQRHYVDTGVVNDAFGLFGAGYDFLEVHSGDQRTDLGTILIATLYDVDDTETNFEVSVLTTGGTTTSATMAFSVILNKWVEFDTRWRCSTTTTSLDGYVTIRMRTSSDGVTWTDLGIIVDRQNVNIATAPQVYRDGATVYGMTIAIGNIGIPGKFYFAKLYDSDVAATSPDIPVDDSVGCCGSDGVEGSGVAAPGAGTEEKALVPGWTARCAGGGAVATASDLPNGERWA